VERLVGSGDRPFRLLSLMTVDEVAELGVTEGTPIAASMSLRDALSELLWQGVQSLPVASADGAPHRRITLPAILARAAAPI
jgi:osmoprotectant transport system ATP-binding protein